MKDYISKHTTTAAYNSAKSSFDLPHVALDAQTEDIYYIDIVAAPVISVENNMVSITSTTTGASIYYTTDEETTPTSSSTQYSNAFSIENDTTIKAIAIKDGISSAVTTQAVTFEQVP